MNVASVAVSNFCVLTMFYNYKLESLAPIKNVQQNNAYMTKAYARSTMSTLACEAARRSNI